MNETSVNFQSVKAKLMEDHAFKVEYEHFRARYQIVAQIITERQKQKMSQEELAERIGTKKSNISRLESGKYNPSLDFLTKVAEALGKELRLTFV